MQNSEYKFVSKHCATFLRNGIEQFCASEIAERKRSRPISIFTRMKLYIDPAWRDYSKIIDTKSPFDQFVRAFAPSEYAKEFGFFTLENWCIQSIDSIGPVENCAKNLPLLELVGTIAELRSFSIWCKQKKPRHITISRNNQSRNFNLRNTPLHCRICDSKTELRNFADTPEMWGGEEFVSRRPSKIFCAQHRPISEHNGKLNSKYQKFLRKSQAIEKEYARIYRQSFSWHESRADTGNPFVDEFIRLVASQNHLYPDEDGAIRQIASDLVDAHISDTKKKIVVALRAGASQAYTAKLLQTSQQAVSKAIAKIPKKFRFDLTSSNKSSL